MKTHFKRCDMFSGGGGASTGGDIAFGEAGYTWEGYAINHWDVSVETYNANHPYMRALSMKVENVNWKKLFHGRKIDHLWASPTCTYFSRARGRTPTNDQERSQPYLVTSVLNDNYVRNVIIENVPEIVSWVTIGENGRPLKSNIKVMDASAVGGVDGGKIKVGNCFRAWIESIRACNYNVEWRIVNCADYGDATTRKRFFLKAIRKGCGKIHWPEPTHAQFPGTDLFNLGLKPWRGAIECIDMNDIGKSIFKRPHPLADNTLLRVQIGLARYDGIELDLIRLFKEGESPCRLSISEGYDKPFIVKLNNGATAEDIDQPLTSVLAGGQHHMLCKPFIVRSNKGCFAESVDAPLSSQQASTVHHAIAQPIIVDHFRNGEAHGVDQPLGTQTTHDRYSVAMPFIIGQQSGAQARPVDMPCPTIATGGALRMVTMVVLDEGTGLPRLPDGRFLDIRMRMLKPSELAAAHSFPPDYVFKGNRTQQIKQIGNSVPVRTAAAMFRADLMSA